MRLQFNGIIESITRLYKVRIEENKTKWTDEELLYILYQLIEGF